MEAEGPHGVELVDARSSDALNLAVLAGAPVLVALEMLEDSDRRQEGDSAEAVLMRRALTACPMTISRAEPQRTAPALLPILYPLCPSPALIPTRDMTLPCRGSGVSIDPGAIAGQRPARDIHGSHQLRPGFASGAAQP